MAIKIEENDETARSIYVRLEAERKPYIDRAEESAGLTIPSLFPKTSDTSSTAYKTPYQSLGARGVNNLASQLLLAIMPANTPFFRLDVTEEAKKSLNNQQVQGSGILSDIQYALSKCEQNIMKYYGSRQFSVTILEGLRQILVAGNYLFFMPPKEGGIKGYRLNNYVIERDGLGKPFNIVARDTMSFASLSKDLKAMATKSQDRKASDKVDIYTHIYLDETTDGYYCSYQELDGVMIPGSDQKYPEDKTPWIPIRMVKVDGENYGRGYVEEIIGDLTSLEGLSKAIVEYSAVASRIIFLVNPNGVTQARKVNNAKNGDYVAGKKEDIQAMTLDKYNDFRVAKETADGLKSELSLSFLLNSAVQRNAERVTAEEIRYVARELEQGLGGIYSILSQELQLPLVRCTIAQLQNMSQLAEFPKGTVEPAITTGIEALGRGQDLTKLENFLSIFQQIPGSERYMKLGGLIKTFATALSIDVNDLVRTEEEVQAMVQQEQQAELAKQVAPQIAGGAVQQELQQQGGQ